MFVVAAMLYQVAVYAAYSLPVGATVILLASQNSPHPCCCRTKRIQPSRQMPTFRQLLSPRRTKASRKTLRDQILYSFASSQAAGFIGGNLPV